LLVVTPDRAQNVAIAMATVGGAYANLLAGVGLIKMSEYAKK
jgi:hypothetical protein